MNYERGLHTVTTRLGEILGLPYDAIFETQRALVREGFLIPRSGRGPRSGVECTDETLAVTLAVYFAARTAREISEMEDHARSFMRLQRAQSKAKAR